MMPTSAVVMPPPWRPRGRAPGLPVQELMGPGSANRARARRPGALSQLPSWAARLHPSSPKEPVSRKPA